MQQQKCPEKQTSNSSLFIRLISFLYHCCTSSSCFYALWMQFLHIHLFMFPFFASFSLSVIRISVRISVSKMISRCRKETLNLSFEELSKIKTIFVNNNQVQCKRGRKWALDSYIVLQRSYLPKQISNWKIYIGRNAGVRLENLQIFFKSVWFSLTFLTLGRM